MRREIYLLVEGLIRVSMVSDAADHGVNSTQFMKLLAVNLSAVLGYVRGCSGSLPGKRAAAEGLHILNRLLDKVENPKFISKFTRRFKVRWRCRTCATCW